MEPGRLFIGFSNPNPSEIEKILQMDNTLAIQMLKRLMALKQKIKLAPYNIDYFLVDSAPGLSHPIILNCMLITDRSFFILSFFNSDVLGKMQMEENKYSVLKEKIVNRIENEVLDIKLTANIQLTAAEKARPMTREEIETYFDEIANDPELKRLLD